MKALVISPTFPPTRSGGADFAFRQCEHLAERGVDVHVVTSRAENVARSDRFAVSAVVREWSWRDLGQILSIARRFRPDVVLIHFAGAIYKHHPMVTFLPSISKRLLRMRRVVLHVEYPDPVVSRPQTRLGRAADNVLGIWFRQQKIDRGYGTLLRESDVIFVLCEPHHDLLAQHDKSVAAKCALMGTPPAIKFYAGNRRDARTRARATLGVGSEDLLLVYYGYIYPDKGLETLLDAFQAVLHEHPSARLLMLGGTNELILRGEKGPRYLEELKQTAAKLGVAEHVLWTGYYPQDSEQPSLLLHAADICVLPFDMACSCTAARLAWPPHMVCRSSRRAANNWKDCSWTA